MVIFFPPHKSEKIWKDYRNQKRYKYHFTYVALRHCLFPGVIKEEGGRAC